MVPFDAIQETENLLSALLHDIVDIFGKLRDHLTCQIPFIVLQILFLVGNISVIECYQNIVSLWTIDDSGIVDDPVKRSGLSGRR